MREPVQITWDAKAIFDRTCDLAHGRLTADELYHVGYSLLLLGLSKMEEEEREAELSVLDASICNGLDGLDALRERRKLNGHAKPKGLA
jgi:hypothetical protein